MATFGELLQRMRAASGLTQAGLSARAGVSLRSIQGWEQDYRCPVSPDFFKIVEALGVSADDFNTMNGATGKPAKRKKGGK
jgi:transcriptional regulator with XRE-family HTH domain